MTLTYEYWLDLGTSGTLMDINKIYIQRPESGGTVIQTCGQGPFLSCWKLVRLDGLLMDRTTEQVTTRSRPRERIVCQWMRQSVTTAHVMSYSRCHPRAHVISRDAASIE